MSLLIKETQQVAYFSVLWPGHAEMKDQKVIKKLDFWPQTLNTACYCYPYKAYIKKRHTTKLTTEVLHPALNSLSSLCHIFFHMIS